MEDELSAIETAFPELRAAREASPRVALMRLILARGRDRTSMGTAHGELGGGGLRLRVLGPVTAWLEDRQVNLGPPLQRATLWVLAAQAGRLVTKDRLVGALWGDAAPKTAEQSVYTYVAGLRRLLEPERGRRGPFTLLTQSANGYSLARDVCRTDAEDFEQRLAEARRFQAKQDLPAWLRELEAGLGLWAGTALGGLPGPFCEAERTRLESLRQTAREDWADALLRLVGTRKRSTRSPG